MMRCHDVLDEIEVNLSHPVCRRLRWHRGGHRCAVVGWLREQGLLVAVYGVESWYRRPDGRIRSFTS